MPNFEGQEKTEQPTGKKLEDARQKGQVAKSSEINSLAIFGSGLIIVFLFKSYIGGQFYEFSTDIFSKLNQVEMSHTVLQTYALRWGVFYLMLMMPILIAVFIASIVSNVSQVGFRITPEAISFSLDKFNPLKGIKRILFSTRSFVELGKSLLKLVIISIFTYFIISELIRKSIQLIDLSIEDTVEFMLDSSFSLIWKIVLFFVVIAAVDYIFQRYKFRKDMMMTKEEVKEELKQTEGDPVVKGRIKKEMMMAARRRMMHEVPKADVVITNPTHVAVALRYEMGKDGAPKVVAKGLDLVAQQIKKIAAENNVPMYEDVELARALYKTCEIGDEIPANLFKAVAQILAYIYQMKKLKKQKSII
ncbi:Flagellar biosynthetic protein FlhB [Melioribacter roseus P3M-2]|uniref:Flagellar biosynthetic protein FlhB n=1 Tax=Melioribacter roseus (strain DSM 23840 / JCM 17771 / VKM B-2668 / P3M-2) TaxID=1191523 RepID=I7A668_MELRP|nr:flagellar biosynthesis protein FlhB [Melioribacter roseus]AFN75376.1 Flagellar biosynthetic protein FlhB [Melioribacter roseus P3M-2]